jgi:hypothetical protein
LNLYLDCEHIEKAYKIVEDIGWNALLSKDWLSSFEISVRGLITAWLCRDAALEKKCGQLFTEVTKGFSADKFTFHAEAETPYSTIPPTITLEFKGTYGNITHYGLAEHIEKSIIPLMNGKLKVLTTEKSAKYVCSKNKDVIRLSSTLVKRN